MVHNTYREMIRARAEAAIVHARAVAGIQHKPTMGALREILVRELFRPLLPADIGVGTGEIISASGQTSTQQDIVLYDQRILPPVVAYGEIGLFPVESVLYTIEVKSTSSAGELRAADQKARDLECFAYTAGVHVGDTPQNHEVEKVISVLFAFQSNLRPGSKELARYENMLGNRPPAIRALCVVDAGYWFCRGDTWQGQLGGGYREVVGFIASIMNRFSVVAASRGHPRIGSYLSDGD